MSKKITILFIEDHKDYREYISIFFRRKGLPVEPVFANDGQAAIDYLFNCSDKTFPDLICVDLYLPQMTGFDFGKHYQKYFSKQHPKTFLFLTTHLSIDKFMEIITDKSTLAPFCEDVIFKPLSINHYQSILMPAIKEKMELIN